MAMMLAKTYIVFLLIFLRNCLSITHTSKDVHVTCLFHEDCILPCSFRPTGAVVIHWYKQQIPVHSYYYNKDQFGLQNKHFSGRTCLFNSQIAQGNASLVLRKVKVQDRGRYKCYTSTRKGNQESFVNLGVKAPILLVKIELTEEKATCLAQNIYPAPQLFWSTEPPTDPGSLQNYTRNTPDSKGLFTIESSVSVLGNISQYAYFCSVLSADGSQVWTASVKRQDELFGEEGSTLLIPCMVPQPRHNFTLTWTFIRTNDFIIIFTYDSRTKRNSNSWENRAEMDIEQVHMGNGSLTLLSPDSMGQTGIYTCTFSSFQMKHQVQTYVNVTVRVTDADENICRRSWWGTAASVFIFVLTISVALSRCLRFRGDQQIHANAGVRKEDDRRTHRTDTPMLDRQAPEEQRHNGLGLVETRSSMATDVDASVFHKPASHNALRGPSPTSDNIVLNVCLDQRDVSAYGTPVMKKASPTSETSRPHTPAAPVPTENPEDIFEPGLVTGDETDQDEEFPVSERVYVNEISLSTEPSLHINGFR